jgi:hypothetical protein
LHPAFWLTLLALLMPVSAHAEWREAASAHFVVYADEGEADLRTFAERLERYHAAMAAVTGRHPPAPSPSNRLTIYVVGSESEVHRLYGEGGKYVSAFYLPRAGASMVIIRPVSGGGSGRLKLSMVDLLHEYAHHFITSTGDFPMPRWCSEGQAEFFAAASFPPDGSVAVGGVARNRVHELRSARDVGVADLIDPTDYDKRHKGYDDFYAKSWLLYRYLYFDKARSGQLQRYLQLIAEGKSSREAGVEAFGDFARLESDLAAYLASPALAATLTVPAALVQPGAIAVRVLGAGEAAIMPVRIRSRRGVTDAQAKALLPEARAVAARFPADPAVLAALAEAEHDAGNDREAIAAADAALAIDPSQRNAYLQKGLSQLRLAAADRDPTAAYDRSRASFAALSRLDGDDALALIYFYRSFVEQGREPSPQALDGLRRAARLAPFDLDLRMLLAAEQIRHHEFAAARGNLGPVAYDPHGGTLAAAAQRVLARMNRDPQWDGQDVASLMLSAAPNDTRDDRRTGAQ